MTERDALLKVLWSQPTEDTVRLVFADWLDEHEESERAAYIRAQIQIAKLVADENYDTDYVAAWQVVAAVSNETLRDWLLAEGVPFPSGDRMLTRDMVADRDQLRDLKADLRVTFRRGFPDGIRCTLAYWLKHARKTPALSRLSKVHLADKRPHQFRPTEWAWRHMDGSLGNEDEFLPSELFELLPDVQPFVAVYETRKAAEEALSMACMRYAGDTSSAGSVGPDEAIPNPGR